MDFLKAQFTHLQQQLSGLNATQKMLIGTIVVIFVIALWFCGLYARQPEMEPVLDQSFSADDLSRVTTFLAAHQIAYKVSGDRVLVPTDHKMEALAHLAYAKMLPRDTTSGFDEIIAKMGSNPWAPDSERRVWYNRGKEMTLGQIIGRFPAVASALVVIDPTDERRVGNSVHPSAIVYITTQSGETSSKKQVANAAADVVAGAVAAISREKIKVIVDGVSVRIHDGGDGGLGGSSEIIDLVDAYERRCADKIAAQLSFIHGVMASVTVDVNIKTSELTRDTPDGTLSKEKTIDSENTESTTPGTSSAEVGVVANVGANVAGGGAGGGSNTHETNKTEFEIIHGHTVENIRTPPGLGTVVAAAVAIPQSYFLDPYKRQNPNAKEPDDATLQALVDKELPTIRGYVKNCTNPNLKDEAITIGTYVDSVPAAGEPPQVAMSSVSLMLGGHFKEIALGVLAVASLFMVSMMVKKSAPLPVLPVPQPVVAQHLATGEDIAGEVGGGNAALDGMELDEDAIKTQQMLEQVATMVEENPDAAANLVKRWLNRS